MKHLIPRRHFLRGLGVSLGLPFLESLSPMQKLLAADASKLAVTKDGRPLRMAFLYVPNGVNEACWRPIGGGSNYQLNQSTASLMHFREHLQFLSGLAHANGKPGTDGGGDHARASATILTGVRPKKTAGSDIRLGISIDQLAAQHVGSQTRFASLELSCDSGRKSASCDAGYSCAYQYNLSWRSETLPVAPETNPRLVFERLFGSGKSSERQLSAHLRQVQQKSILDFAMEEAKMLRKEMGRNDQNKLDEYLTGVREIETRIQKAEQFGPLPDPGRGSPEGIPTSYQEHIRLMMDMQILAFQTDSTRISTFMLAHDGGNRSFNEIGVSDGHHNLSHHQQKAESLAKIAQIDQFYTSQFAYFLQRMRETQDGSSSLLDNSMVVYCSGLADGDKHSHDNLPVILAGRAGGELTPGRHLEVSPTPMTNLYMRMLQIMGVPAERFGDSTGVLGNV